MPSAWLPQKGWQRGEVSPSFAARFATEEQLTGARKLENWLVDYDGSLELRFGTYHVMPTRQGNDAGAATGVKARIFPTSISGTDYLIVMTSGSTASLDQEIYVYERQADDTFTTSPIQYSTLTSGIDLPANDQLDSVPHPYSEEELDEVEMAQLGNYIVFTHPNHPSAILKYSGGVLADRWSWNPFYGLDAEVVSFRDGTAFTATPDTSPEAGLVGATHRVESTSAVFTEETLGGMVMVGDFVPSTGGSSSVGRYFRILEILSTTTALVSLDDVYPVANPGPVLDATRFAGPWTAQYGTSAPGSTFTGFSPGTNVFYGGAFSAALPPNALTTNDSFVGTILQVRVGATDYYLLIVAQSGVTATYRNIGTTIPPNGIPTGQDCQLFYPSLNRRSGGDGVQADFMSTTPQVTISSDTQSGSSQYLLTVERAGDVNDEHLDGFQTLLNADVGGALFINGGVARLVSRNASAAPGFRYDAFNIVWEKEPTSLAPSRSYGLGPSRATGFASVVTTHQNRLVLSGFRNTAVVMSQTNNPLLLNGLELVGQDSAPVNFNLGGSGRPSSTEQIKWVSSEKDLLIGTTEGEYSVRGTPITNNSIGIDAHSEYGGAGVRPVRVGAKTLFVQKGGQVLREMQFTESSQRYESPNITRHISHMLAEGETWTRMVQLYEPSPLVFLLTSAGRIVLLSRSSEDGVAAFTPTATPDSAVYTDIARVRKEGGAGDEVWCVVRRDGTHQIERFSPSVFTDSTQVLTEAAGEIFDISSPAGATITGVRPHLRNKTVGVILDGRWLGEHAVTSAGNIDLSDEDITSPVSATIGLVYSATAHFNVLDVQDGSSVSGHKNIPAIRLFVEDSIGGGAGDSLATTELEVPLNSAITTVTGWVDVPQLLDESGRDVLPEFVVDTPFRVRISALTSRVEWEV